MGQAISCLKKNSTLDLQKPKAPKAPEVPKNIPKMPEKSEEEKAFEKLVKEVETPADKRTDHIYFQFTRIPSIDKVIRQAQTIVNEVHKIRLGFKLAYRDMIARTAIWACGGDVGHAIVALIYCIFAQCNREDADNLIIVQKKFPWFKKGKDSIPPKVAKDVKKLFDYFHALEKAIQRFPDLVKECIELGKKAIELKDTLDKDIKNADEWQKTRALKSVPHNIKMLKRLPTLANNTMKFMEMNKVQLEFAYNVILEEQHDLQEYGRILADEGIFSPSQCYKRVGKPIEKKGKAKTEEDFLRDDYLEEEQKEGSTKSDGEKEDERAGEGDEEKVDEED